MQHHLLTIGLGIAAGGFAAVAGLVVLYAYELIKLVIMLIKEGLR